MYYITFDSKKFKVFGFTIIVFFGLGKLSRKQCVNEGIKISFFAQIVTESMLEHKYT